VPQGYTFEQIVELSNEGIWVLDEHALAAYVNPRAAEMFGYTPAEVIGRPVEDFLFPEDRAFYAERLAALRKSRSESMEARFRHRDGHKVWCLVSARTMHAPDGRFVGVLGLASDVTARREAVAALRRSEERYRLMTANSADVIWTLDLPTRRFTFVSPAVERLRGLTAEEVMAQPLEAALTPESLRAVEGLLAGRLEPQQRGTSLVAQLDQPRKDGSIVPTEVVTSLVLDESGTPVTVVGISRDITERRRVEAALRESALLLRESQRVARVGSYVYDIAGNHWTSSEVLDEIFGIDAAYPRDVEGWLNLVHPDDRAMMTAYLQNLIATRGRFDKQYRVLRPSDGGTRWVQGYGELHLNAAGEPVRMFGAIQDITAQRRQEDERRQLEARLVQGQKLESLGVLAGGVAHEFNNLLTSILGNVDLAVQDLPPHSPVREYLRSVEMASRRAAEISHQMLAYSGRGRFVVERTDVSRLVRDMGAMLEVSVPKGTPLRYDLREGLPPVEADATQLRQMVLNLVLNAAEALDARGGGSVLVRTGLETCGEDTPCVDHFNDTIPPGDYLALEVVDSGAGMDAATRARIFDPFFSTKFTGRGLGLPAVLGVVRGHHGFIEVKSQPGQGSSFKVLLPVLPAPPLRDRRAATTPAADAALVLVVDDESSVRTLTMRLIERCGYRAVGAADGVEALALLRPRHAEFSCVLLDLTMPRMGGEETLRELRVFAPLLPVLVSSGYEGSELSRRLQALHVAGFIQKPYQLADLKGKIESVLASARE